MPGGSKRSDMCEAAGWSAGSLGSLVTLHRKLCSISCAACAAHKAARSDGGANGMLPDDGSRAEFARSITTGVYCLKSRVRKGKAREEARED